jgi:adenosylhomocysteine nucleosidase
MEHNSINMRLAIQICAELEWKCTTSILKSKHGKLRAYPFGQYFKHPLGKYEAIIYESGATKTRAAAACQYAINQWHPDAIINLGTCGGVAQDVKKGDYIVANKTLQYDVFQKFGKPSLRFKRGLITKLNTSWVDLGECRKQFHAGIIASADQDLDFKNRRLLNKRGVLAADWESASIATICALNKVRCLIMRGVSDIPVPSNQSSKIHQGRDYSKNTSAILENLISVIAQAEFHINGHDGSGL